MQRALRPYLTTGIAIAGASSLIAVTPVAPSLPDVHVPAIQLTADTGLLGDIDSLLGGLTSPLTAGADEVMGDLGNLLGGFDFNNVLSGLDPGDFTSPLTGLTGMASSAAVPVITAYTDLFTKTFADLEAIVAERLADPAPILSAVLDNQVGYVEQVLANPASIVDIPGEIARHLYSVFGTLTNLLTLSPDLTTSPPTLDIMLGVPIALAIGGLSPLLAPVDAAKDIVAGLTGGDPTTALTALVDAPATLANFVLGGLFRPDLHLSIPFTVAQVDQVNLYLAEAGFPTLPVTDYDAPVSGIGGLVDTLVNYVPQQIAAALTGHTAEIAINPITAILSLLSGGLLSTTAGELSSTLTTDLASQLPALLMDPLSLFP